MRASRGKRSITLPPANQAQTLPNIHQDSLTLTEIQQGLNAGKEVIVHTDPIQVPGWTGAGYIIFDPEDGSGAYKITGGGNGSWQDLADLVQKLISYLAGFGSLIIKWLGPLGEVINAAITIIIALWNCPSPHAQNIVILTIAFTLVSIGLAYLISTRFHPVAGVLAAFLFGAAIYLWLDEYRDYQCET